MPHGIVIPVVALVAGFFSILHVNIQSLLLSAK